MFVFYFLYCTTLIQNNYIKDLGSGMNYGKKGLQKLLLEKILRKQTKRLVLTHKDRLLRFGVTIRLR